MSISVNLGTDYLNIKEHKTINLNETLTVYTENGPILLEIDISADLEKIPAEYHEIFVNALTSKYINKVSFGDNPFSQCRPIVKRKWYQFWKSKFFQK